MATQQIDYSDLSSECNCAQGEYRTHSCFVHDQPLHLSTRSKANHYLTAPQGKSNRGKSHIRLINKVCLEALESKDVSMREKLKAAGILERMRKAKDLAARRRARLREKSNAKKCHSRQFPSLE